MTTTSLGAGFQDAAVVRMQASGKKVTGAAAWGASGEFGFETGGGVAVASDGTVLLGASTTLPPMYVLQGLSVKVSAARGAATATADNPTTVVGVVADPAEGAAEPPGSTTHSGNFESALVRFTLP